MFWRTPPFTSWSLMLSKICCHARHYHRTSTCLIIPRSYMVTTTTARSPSLSPSLYYNNVYNNSSGVNDDRGCDDLSNISQSSKKIVVNYVAIRQSNKRLLRVTGPDAFIYLQSLLTQDMRLLLPLDHMIDLIRHQGLSREQIETRLQHYAHIALNQPALYSYLLNSNGRVLCDVFVYRGRYRALDSEYIVEVDATLVNAVKRLLLQHNITRKIQVEYVHDIDLWSVIPLTSFTDSKLKIAAVTSRMDNDHHHHERDSSHELVGKLEEIDSDDIKLIVDPRFQTSPLTYNDTTNRHLLGYRFLSRLGNHAGSLESIGKYLKLSDLSESHHKVTEHINLFTRQQRRLRLYEGQLSDYRRLRYRLGIVEGYRDLLSGFYYPFELNGDLLNAISLDKGLYTSEEKMITTYSAAPIKRRIFPIKLIDQQLKIRQGSLPAPRTIIAAPGQPKFGTLVNRIGQYGVATLWVPMVSGNMGKFPPWFWKNRLSNKQMITHKFPQLIHADTGLRMSAYIPHWWPSDVTEMPQLPVPDYPRCLFDFDAAAVADEAEKAAQTAAQVQAQIEQVHLFDEDNLLNDIEQNNGQDNDNDDDGNCEDKNYYLLT